MNSLTNRLGQRTLRSSCARIFGALFLFALMAGNSFAQTAPAPAPDNEYLVGAVLWTQTSGEYRALTYQAFNLARMKLDEDFRVNRRRKMKRAVVVDVDETVMDNSRYEAMLVRDHKNHSTEEFNRWCESLEAGAVPGAVEFLRYAASRGVRVFYVTNRKEPDKQCTAATLKKLGFPDVSDETVQVRTDPNSSLKEPRRRQIALRHRIVLLIGDNLNDLAIVFEESKTTEARMAAVEKVRAEFGRRFIVIPNAMYGEWESAAYGPGRLTDEEKAIRRRAALKAFGQ